MNVAQNEQTGVEPGGGANNAMVQRRGRSGWYVEFNIKH